MEANDFKIETVQLQEVNFLAAAKMLTANMEIYVEDIHGESLRLLPITGIVAHPQPNGNLIYYYETAFQSEMLITPDHKFFLRI